LNLWQIIVVVLSAVLVAFAIRNRLAAFAVGAVVALVVFFFFATNPGTDAYKSLLWVVRWTGPVTGMEHHAIYTRMAKRQIIYEAYPVSITYVYRFVDDVDGSNRKLGGVSDLSSPVSYEDAVANWILERIR